jgi:ubiquinone/menaquinone biosynthesis C-methylase UbiE
MHRIATTARITIMVVAVLMTVSCPLFAQRQIPRKSAKRRPAAREAPDGLFRLLDKNRDGALSSDEMQAASAALRALDTNSDGTLTPQEVKEQQEATVPPGINDRFLDPNLAPEEWVKRLELESRDVFASRIEILKALNLSEGDRIADIGAGTGLFESIFSKSVGPTGKVYAVDISPRLIEYMKGRVATEKLANVEVVLSNESSAELENDSIDIAFICDTYHHFEYHAEMLLSIRNALCRGGELVLIDFERIPGKSSDFIMGHVRAGKEVFRREIERSGFRFVEEVEIPGFRDTYFLRFERP